VRSPTQNATVNSAKRGVNLVANIPNRLSVSDQLETAKNVAVKRAIRRPNSSALTRSRQRLPGPKEDTAQPNGLGTHTEPLECSHNQIE
jgi:hypothetical protein